AASARPLCNCALSLSAGESHRMIPLRTPITAPPLVVTIEKPAAPIKWNIDDLPGTRFVMIEATKFDGLPRQKLEPNTAIRPGPDEELVIWTGPADDALVLGLKVTA